jgi:mannosyltransferase OCH1-like enzyme/Tfp pilus assembly protein PilF
MSQKDFKLVVGSAQEARKQGDRELALSYYREALALQPNHSTLPNDVAIELQALGRTEEATEVLKKLKEDHPTSLQAAVGLAAIARKQGDRELALSYYREALALQPNHSTLPNDVAIELQALGRTEEATEVLKKLKEDHPTSLQAAVGLAAIARKQGDRELALSYYREALALQPNHSTLPNDVAIELQALGRTEEALTVLDEATSLVPELMWDRKGQIYLAQSNHFEAKQCFHTGLSLFPQTPRFYQALITEYMKDFQFDLALELIEQASKNISTTNHFYVHQIRCLVAKGYLEDAIDLCRQSLLNHSDEFILWFHLCELYLRTGLFSEVQKLLIDIPQRTILERQQVCRMQSELAKAQYDLVLAKEIAHNGFLLDTKNTGFKNYLVLLDLMLGSTSSAHAELKRLRALAQSDSFHNVWPSALGNIQGRLYAEMRTNPFAEQQLSSIYEKQISEWPAALSRIMQDEPNYIGFGMLLLGALRSLGCLSELNQAGHFEQSPIPKVIVQYWDAEHIPEDIQKTMSTWAEVNPGYEHRIFNDVTAELFLKNHFDSSVVRAFQMSNHAAMRADIFRLAYLKQCGGIYADADDLCRHSIDSWFDVGCELFLLQEHLGTVGNNFIASRPNHPFVEVAFERVLNQILNRQGDVWFASGPGCITVTFCQYYLDSLSCGLLPDGVIMKTCYELEQKISIQLPRQYKRSNQNWSSRKGAQIPIYR